MLSNDWKTLLPNPGEVLDDNDVYALLKAFREHLAKIVESSRTLKQAAIGVRAVSILQDHPEDEVPQ